MYIQYPAKAAGVSLNRDWALSSSKHYLTCGVMTATQYTKCYTTLHV